MLTLDKEPEEFPYNYLIIHYFNGKSEKVFVRLTPFYQKELKQFKEEKEASEIELFEVPGLNENHIFRDKY